MANQQKPERKKVLIRKGDQVVVISGKSRDRKTPREVLQVLPKEGKIVVAGVNVVKDTKKARSAAETSSVVEKEMPIDASNVQLIDPKSGQPTRVRLQKDADGKRQRVSVKSGEVIS
jgi:large subunit ribosomal protein L24